MTTQIYNGDILLPDKSWIQGSLIIKDSKIIDILKSSELLEDIDIYIDADGGFILPGAIDMHVHGAGGHDFMEGTEEAFQTIIDIHRRHGTTSILPSLASATPEETRLAAVVCTEMMKNPKNGILGLHYEGPYFAPAMTGGQIGGNIRKPDPAEYESLILDFPCIKRWDAAPEVVGGDLFAKFAVEHGVVVGLAHTQIDDQETIKAFNSGYTLATHFYNAMTTVHKNGIYKKAGAVEAIYLIDEMDVEVISDGIHVPPTLLRLIHKIKGAEHTALVTDALAITESENGKSIDDRIVIENGVCKLRDGSALAGSCATMDRLIRTCVEQAGIPLEEVSIMSSLTPARILGVDNRKGSLEIGKDADIIIFDRGLHLTHVVAMGENINL